MSAPAPTAPAPTATLPDPLPVRLNVGCGWDRRPGFLNVDLQAFHEPDLVADATDLPMLPDGHFEEVVAQDVLEHLERERTVPALREWARLLAPGGVLALRVPSLLDTFGLLADPARREPAAAAEVIHLVYGTQGYRGDYHLSGFTAATLGAQLAEAGLLVCEAKLRDGWLFEVRARKTRRLEAPEEIVHEAFFRVLRRPANPDELRHFGGALAAGRPREAVEGDIAGSEEARFRADHPAFLVPYAGQLRGAGTAAAHAASRAEAETLRREIAALRASTSWRLTGPLRRLARTFGRR
ncbi:MAG: methyltransferase domain-containing protein [Acetobacteraceae bacterium]|nr:methyltransferase domain-containing protein [Acetobacteraceae bacterium]